jgi:hypothetical protein
MNSVMRPPFEGLRVTGCHPEERSVSKDKIALPMARDDDAILLHKKTAYSLRTLRDIALSRFQYNGILLVSDHHYQGINKEH